MTDTGGSDRTAEDPSASSPSRWRDERIAFLALLLAIAFNLVQLYAEVSIEAPSLNDGVLHRLALDRLASTVASGENPTDPWFAPIAMGFPLFHYYQPFAYLPPAMLHWISLGTLPLTDLFNYTAYLLLCFFPLSIYWSARRFGFGLLPASLSGVVASLVATNGLFGFDFSSYVWRGLGMYTQLWVMFLLPLALAQCNVTLKNGRGYFWATLLLAVTVLSHLLIGYIAVVSVIVLAVLGGATSKPWRIDRDRMKRLLLMLMLAAIVTAYFWVPFYMDNAYFNRSVWEEPQLYDSYGARSVLGALVRGELFDHARWPVLTVLVFAGLGSCLWRWREERYRIPAALFLFWLVLYFGRPTWGFLLDLLPLSHDLRLNRLIAGMHLGGIYLAGLGLALPWRWATSRRDNRDLAVPLVLTAVLLVPAYRERKAYLDQNATWMRETQLAYAAGARDLEALMQTLKALPPGRVYAGRSADWGHNYTVGAVPVYALLNRAGFDMVGTLYHAMSLNADIQVLFDHTRPDHYNLFNIRYLVVPVDWPVTEFFELVGDFGRHRLLRAPTTGYFDLVRAEPAFTGDKSEWFPAASHWLASELPRAKQHPVVDLDGSRAVGPHPLLLRQAVGILDRELLAITDPPGRIRSESVGNGTYQAEVDMEHDATLMLKVTYHPNWRATIDDVAAEASMLMPSFIGVKVPVGAHRVRLVYRPGALRTALLPLGLLALFLTAAVERRSRNAIQPFELPRGR